MLHTHTEKTRMCQRYKNGTCPDGEDCRFAHSQRDLRITDFFYKTKACHQWRKGKCTQGDNCRHAHGNQDIQRHASVSMDPLPPTHLGASKSMEVSSPRRVRNRRDSLGSYEGDPDAYPSQGFPTQESPPALAHQDTHMEYSDSPASFEKHDTYEEPVQYPHDYYTMGSPTFNPAAQSYFMVGLGALFTQYTPPAPAAYLPAQLSTEQMLGKVSHGVTNAQMALKTLALTILEAYESKVDEATIKETLQPLSHCVTPYISMFQPESRPTTAHSDGPANLHLPPAAFTNARHEYDESMTSPLARAAQTVASLPQLYPLQPAYPMSPVVSPILSSVHMASPTSVPSMRNLGAGVMQAISAHDPSPSSLMPPCVFMVPSPLMTVMPSPLPSERGE
ncbi:MAG: uncharacterized protein KVP18_002265 [Porospora cf. gigantea A]|uniref:uncharacterized protein n=1 Tax=Porospora cf. gigantea A TaxID=2853593 RepID=UPI003559DE0E|nr:MAG: hypothetical protein KVP18_002265 [Porospora cf. gigantea A]